MKEKIIQDQIRQALSYEPDINLFRTNVGSGWVGKFLKNPDGSVTIFRPRWFQSGLPKGFPDLCGYVVREISQKMVGKKIAQFAFIEVKNENGRPSKEQIETHRKFLSDGAVGGITRSVEEAIIILRGGCDYD